MTQLLQVVYSKLHTLLFCHAQALAGEVGMSAELDEVAKSLYNGQLPSIWRALAPATLKGLGNWIIHFHKRNQQYIRWVCVYTYCSICTAVHHVTFTYL